jgi:hypothetical protein
MLGAPSFALFADGKLSSEARFTPLSTQETSVFSSPTDKVYETPTAASHPNLIEKAAKQIAPILDPIAKMISHK